MYVVQYKNRVTLGIIPWNNQYIMDVMKIRHRETISLPYLEPNISEFPYRVNDDLIIYPAEENRPNNINPMIEYYIGPSWEFLSNKVIAHYEISPLSLIDAKENFKNKAAYLRHIKENAGTKININGTEYIIETDRESRKKYVEKLVIIGNKTVNWKFSQGQGWVTLSKENFESIVSAIDNHVQSTFDEEFSLNIEINNAQDVNTLLSIEVLNAPPNIVRQN